MRKRVIIGLLAAAAAAEAGNVFDMPQVFPQHRQLQQQFIQAFRAGKTAEMEEICRAGIDLMPDDPTWQYNLACALAYRADKADALAALDRAIMLGFRDSKVIAEDSDLKSLAALPEFKALVAKAAELKGKPIEGAPQVGPTTGIMGLPVEVNAGNTTWDFNVGAFQSFFTFIRPDKKGEEVAEAYQGPAQEAVAGWLRENQASGNFGDIYLNRDDGHSALEAAKFPGLTPVLYSAEAKTRNAHWGLANGLFDFPVIGNASIAIASGPMQRSMPRAAQTDPFLPLLAFQITLNNQCWFYPAHLDYTPENGDLFLANVPYYVTSLGASFTDKPFMEAFAAALAALRPETKRALIQSKRLAPILQMTLRATQKTVKKPEDYLTGAAHPVVFDAANLDAEAMVSLAHALTPETLPPLVMLRTVSDAKAEMGVDYFDLRPEGLFDTPFAIARVVRGVLTRERTMTLEAVAPGPPGAQTQYLWRVLQGDEKKITIKPLTPNAARVEITVGYHGTYRPTLADGSQAALPTSRVDIGCFVKAGDYYSPPSIVSFGYLGNEERLYRDDGKVQSVDYANTAHRYADPVLTLHKGWKDLYEYDAQGRLKGWYRMRGGNTAAAERFTYAGHRVQETDALNRPTRACAVQYLPRQQSGASVPPVLSTADTFNNFTYTYANDNDLIGKFAPAK
ncbi:MAG: hypothetical protein FWG50_07375 [Kiritimatiellaeota bacterium]|nr:hypothetical protein [Kiritimatiellota bacterium]